MLCWVCEASASGVCNFCGRAVCKNHAATKAFLFEAWNSDGDLYGLAVEDAVHCGVCKINSEPIRLDFLRPDTEQP